MTDSAWSWKARPGAGDDPHTLRYEPGNWGDVLKGTWAVLVAEALLEQHQPGPFRVLDPFAGAPTYALTPNAAARIEIGGVFARTQEPFRKGCRLASTSVLVDAACRRQGVTAQLDVFDLDERRRQLWSKIDNARLIPVRSGEEALEQKGRLVDLVLVDPYDFFDHWGRLLPEIWPIAHHTPVLVYFYNKSPRGHGHLDQYKRLHSTLRAAAQEEKLGACGGRLPADGVLPRAYHEMVLVGPVEFVHSVVDRLETETTRIAERLAKEGAFERFTQSK